MFQFIFLPARHTPLVLLIHPPVTLLPLADSLSAPHMHEYFNKTGKIVFPYYKSLKHAPHYALVWHNNRSHGSTNRSAIRTRIFMMELFGPCGLQDN
jgi:hypothetical protein